MFENAKWISCDKDTACPYIERTFNVTAPQSAVMRICGMGWFVLYINGKRVSEDRFVPAVSDYIHRDLRRLAYPLYDYFGHRMYYLEYDITPYLIDGDNTIGILLGPGWWKRFLRRAEGDVSFSDRMMAVYEADISCADGNVRVESDGSEKWRPSEKTFCDLFIGEVIDATFDANNAPRLPVKTETAPDTKLVRQECTPDRIIRRVELKKISAYGDTVIYDAGENITGWAVVKGGQAGKKAVLRFTEELGADGRPDFFSTGSSNICIDGRRQIQSDTYIYSGESREYRPEFTWHGFRYVEVTGEAPEIWAEVVHTDARQTGTFTCSDPLMNWIFDAYCRSQADNLHDCVPSDCPHRERLGYTGDGQITCKAAMLTYDMKHVYDKWIDDILDSQDRLDGHIQHTAPAMGGGGGPGGWGGAVVIVPDEYARHYGDTDMLRKCYPAMRLWLGYMKSHCEADIVVREEYRGWCLGDWASVDDILIPDPFVNTCFLLDCVRRAQRIAGVLGYDEDAKLYSMWFERMSGAVADKYWDRLSGSFCGGAQAADAYAVWLGIAPDGRALENLVERYEKAGWLDTGFLGTEILIGVLMRTGHSDTAVKLLTSTGRGSYGRMQAAGATTLWEYFQGIHSHNHPMYGAPVRHFYEDILGIRQKEGTSGYTCLCMEPVFPKKLEYARGGMKINGREVKAGWRRADGSIEYTVEIPEGVSAVLMYKAREYALTVGTNTLTLEL